MCQTWTPPCLGKRHVPIAFILLAWLAGAPLAGHGAFTQRCTPGLPSCSHPLLYFACFLAVPVCSKEIQQYKFSDDEFEICVICQLDEGVPLERVRRTEGVGIDVPLERVSHAQWLARVC